MIRVIPGHVPDAPPPKYDDSFDVPVLVRSHPANKPSRKQQQTAKYRPWIWSKKFPNDGWYSTTTTWRDIIKAATEVGRDVTPHLLNQPQYAHRELAARVAPLYAYLGALDFRPLYPVPGAIGRRLTLNPVYAYGTERTAKNAAAYRLGMTMAEWACRSLLGLGQTEHLELGGPVPALHKKFKNAHAKLPDLWGRHNAEATYWLIEAKGGDVGLPALRKGWAQLQAGSSILAAYPHRIVLVGTSARPKDDLFLTIDHNLCHDPRHRVFIGPGSGDDFPTGPESPEDDLGDSDDALLAAARAQMLTYFALRYARPSQLRTALVPAQRGFRRTGLITPLERTDTAAMRADAGEAALSAERSARRNRIRDIGLDDFLTCRIAETGIHLGMSRQLFAACATLHARAIELRAPSLLAEEAAELVDDEREERGLDDRRNFYTQLEEALPRLQRQLREAYETAAEDEWSDLLDSNQNLQTDAQSDEILLEAITPGTYLAVSGDMLPAPA